MKDSAIKKMLLDESLSKHQQHQQQQRNSSMGRAGGKNNFDLVSIKKSSLNDLLLETGVYISATKTQTVDGRCDANLSAAMLAIGTDKQEPVRGYGVGGSVQKLQSGYSENNLNSTIESK